jgi:hypothetical protein
MAATGIVVYLSTIPTYVFFYKFISYVASYICPIQTGFLRGLQKCYGRTGTVIHVKKNATGTENTGILRIPAGICFKGMAMHNFKNLGQ